MGMTSGSVSPEREQAFRKVAGQYHFPHQLTMFIPLESIRKRCFSPAGSRTAPVSNRLPSHAA